MYWHHTHTHTPNNIFSMPCDLCLRFVWLIQTTLNSRRTRLRWSMNHTAPHLQMRMRIHKKKMKKFAATLVHTHRKNLSSMRILNRNWTSFVFYSTRTNPHKYLRARYNITAILNAALFDLIINIEFSLAFFISTSVWVCSDCVFVYVGEAEKKNIDDIH